MLVRAQKVETEAEGRDPNNEVEARTKKDNYHLQLHQSAPGRPAPRREQRSAARALFDDISQQNCLIGSVGIKWHQLLCKDRSSWSVAAIYFSPNNDTPCRRH